MVRAVRQGNPLTPERVREHRAFHAALIDACGSHWITNFSETLFDCARRYQGLSMTAGGAPRNVEAEHRPIMDAVLARDVELSVRLLNEHVSLTADIVSNMGVLQAPGDTD
jgi:DNA-binding GntR family transcriptional regulator